MTPDDVNDLPALTQLMNSLEFCNAVAQVAHPTVQKQLLEFLYQGFLIPVMGPALLQVSDHLIKFKRTIIHKNSNINISLYKYFFALKRSIILSFLIKLYFHTSIL